MAYNSSHTGKEIDTAVDQVEDLTKTVDGIRISVNKNNETIQQHVEKLITIQSKLNGITNTSEQSNREILKLKADMELKASLDSVKNIEEQIKSLATTNTINNIQGQLTVLNDSIRELNEEKADQTSINIIQKKAQSAIDAVSNLSDIVSPLSNTVSSNSNTINQNSLKIIELEAQINNDIKSNIATLVEKDTQLERLIQQNTQSLQNLSTIESNIQEILLKLDAEEQLNNQQAEAIINLTKLINDQNEIIADLQARIISLEEQIKNNPSTEI